MNARGVSVFYRKKRKYDFFEPDLALFHYYYPEPSKTVYDRFTE